jgi:DNA uptake protein ComE-like DNA-binding protein
VKKILNIQPVCDWFGYTRRERRSTFILLIIFIIVIFSRYAVPEKSIDLVDAGFELSDSLSFAEFAGEERTHENVSRGYNPGKASNDTLLGIRLESRQAGTRMKQDARSQPVSSGSASRFQLKKKLHLNLNTCDTSALVSLPGIGPILSVRIIKYRNLLGGFARVEQLLEVYGLKEETYQLIRERVFADSSEVRKIKVNSADYRGLVRIPYIEKYEVSAILKFRELAGRISSMEDLRANKILTPEKAKKIAAYIDFE